MKKILQHFTVNTFRVIWVNKMGNFIYKQDRQCTCNVILRGVRATVVGVKNSDY